MTNNILAELKKIGSEMNTQDNRSTQFPLFVIQVLKKVYKENGNETERRDIDYIDTNDLCENCARNYDKGGDFPDVCDECPSSLFISFDEEWQFDLRPGVFFTAKACEDHIAQNDYHYDKEIRSYAIGAWRNPEMQSVMQALSVFGSKKDGDVVDASFAKAHYKKYE